MVVDPYEEVEEALLLAVLLLGDLKTRQYLQAASIVQLNIGNKGVDKIGTNWRAILVTMITPLVAAFRTIPYSINRMTLDTMHLFQVQMRIFFPSGLKLPCRVWDCFHSDGHDTITKQRWSIESFA